MNKSKSISRHFILFSLLLLFIPESLLGLNEKGSELAKKVVERAGGIRELYSKKDIEYVYIVRHHDDKLDISVEKYVFDGELSRGEYLVHESFMPDVNGTIIQGYNGKESWITVESEETVNRNHLKTADFLRKTNYYWLTMMFKLTDPGTKHEYIGSRDVEGQKYELLKLTFEEGTGDVQDTYILYIDPDTMLVDRFLFTVMDFNRTEPLLMEMRYRSHEGIMLPVYRRYVESDWQGNPVSDKWTEEISVNPRFDNGFSEDLFDLPSKVNKR